MTTVNTAACTVLQDRPNDTAVYLESLKTPIKPFKGRRPCSHANPEKSEKHMII